MTKTEAKRLINTMKSAKKAEARRLKSYGYSASELRYRLDCWQLGWMGARNITQAQVDEAIGVVGAFVVTARSAA